MNRIEEKSVVFSGNQNKQERLVEIPQIVNSAFTAPSEQSDLSSVFLIFVLLFSIVELGLVLSLQKINP
ncbi:MAG: hypothetical protein H3C47_11745 [Candidatus Cloacimonetes bacterium]|nr:hypothetical protein [Candidatus Cloacimonadota bacterium]